MRPSRRSALVTAVLVLVASGIVHAQTKALHIGPRLGYNFDLEDVNLGVQLGVPLFYRVEFYPSFDYYFRDPGSAWALNGDVKWRVFKDKSPWFYLGTGLNLTNVSFEGEGDTDAGLNLFIGAESLGRKIHPFVEGRVTLADHSLFQVQAGLNITIGH